MSIADQAIEIIRLTNDGDDLSPGHLKLVELAVNNFLSPEGETAFAELHQSVLTGYKKPWHCGVEHVTKDHVGFIYWRTVQLEHFSYRHHEDEIAATRRLGEACLYLEAQNMEVTFPNYCIALARAA